MDSFGGASRYARERRRARERALAAAAVFHFALWLCSPWWDGSFVSAVMRAPVGEVDLRVESRAAPEGRPRPRPPTTPEWRPPPPAPPPPHTLPAPAKPPADAEAFETVALPPMDTERTKPPAEAPTPTLSRTVASARTPPDLSPPPPEAISTDAFRSIDENTAETVAPTKDVLDNASGGGVASTPNARPAGVSRAAEAVTRIQPDYPMASRRAREEGVVEVAVDFDAAGRVAGMRVHRSSGHRRLDEAALRAARRTDFHPPRRDGRPVAATQTMLYEFRLR